MFFKCCKMLRKRNFPIVLLATFWLNTASVISASNVELKAPIAVSSKNEEALKNFEHFPEQIIFPDELASNSDPDDLNDSSEEESKELSMNKINAIAATENKIEKNQKSTFDFEHSSLSDELTSDEYDEILNIDLKHNNQQDHNWDVLIFTQQWPVTTCYHWREEDKTHACTLPTKKEFWTIHGIWPTKLGHFGPNFCNKTADFNINQLQEIADRLRQFWPDIDGESQYDWLWKHEWLKHGTCAALLKELDDELKYFGQGLKWRDEYSMTNILAASNIHPDSNNTVVALQTALLKGLSGKNPSIHCLYDDKHDVSYLAEIRICFNKTLDLMDCDGVKHNDAVQVDYPGGTVITNCHISKPVHYPSLVPALQRQQNADKWKFPIVNMYKLLQFIMWFTL